MVTVLGMWEPDWMDAERTERRLWKQTIQAFAVDRWAMAGVQGGPFTSPLQYESLEAMVVDHRGPKTFLIPRASYSASQRLSDYEHPTDAIYVFGNSTENLVRHVTESDAVVSIYTPERATMFGHVALSAVLYDRMVKQ